MPIGRLVPPTAGGNSVIPDGEALGDIRKGAAVALISNGSGRTQIIECSAMSYGDKFYGFAQQSATSGNNLVIQTMRGSIITPIIENGSSIAPEDPVFLSRTVGEIIPGPPEKYPSGLFGISYTGADLSNPQTLTNQTGATADTTEVMNFPIMGGDSWVFRSLFFSKTSCTVEFRVTGVEVYFYWNTQKNQDVTKLKSNDAITKLTGGPSTGYSGVLQIEADQEYPLVLMGNSGNLTLEWNVNGGGWQSEGVQNLRKYVTLNYLPGPVVVQVGFGVSNSEITLILDQRIRVL